VLPALASADEAARPTKLTADFGYVKTGGTARGAAVYGYDFAQKSRFEARGAYLLNLKDTEDSEGNARFSLTAPVAGSLALKVSYDLAYRNKPLPGLEKTDTTFGVGVQATF